MNRYSKFLLMFVLLSGLAQAKSPQKAEKFTNADCLACHNDASLTKEENGKQVSLQVKEEQFKNSIHGSMFSCTDCHKDVTSVPHESTPAKPSCAQCHGDEQKAYDNGLHAKARAAGDQQAARCVDCHGDIHAILPASDPASKVSHKNIAATCGSCHGQQSVMQQAGETTRPFTSYQDSVHAKLVAAGNEKAAVCSDCHGTHDMRRISDPQSPVYKTSVPATCAKCHEAQRAEFMKSIHGQAISKGNLHAPVCTDCHSSHMIKDPKDPSSTVSSENLATNTCAQCHENVKMSRDFGIVGGRESSYLASYHGLATARGSKIAANCASCHGVHNILPSSDPNSTINKAHLVQTCGKCHPGANANFAASKMHLDAHAADIGSKAVALIRRFYLLMIIATIGGMLLHNALVMRRKLVDIRNGHAHLSGGPRIVLRMTFNQRMQHMTLFVSFFVLVATGFALKYPESWLGLLFLGETVRSVLHRSAGVVLIMVGIYHAWYVAATREGRKLVVDFLPEWKDVTDVKDVLFYYLRLSGDKPQFKRFNYAEKMEYWALVWGTIVMAVTGVMIWAKVGIGNHLPRWVIDAATAVHFYEAILASLAILVWHFYMIIFDPEVYPMNWAWYDGKVTYELYQSEHALDVETLNQAVEAEEREQEQREVPPEQNSEENVPDRK